jgi:D-alanyl-D-alanine carboxypeptidase/D-alanyl-D-alanine-endopeptidase (penicillin-binding protein 4)
MMPCSRLMFLAIVIALESCAGSRFISQPEQADMLQQADMKSAHVGIAVYDPAADKYLYNYQGDKYFVPASNTKLFSLYAGMKYLGDSLVGIRYIERDTDILILPAGDPTLLHRDFSLQPVVDFLKKKNIYVVDANWKEKALGAGWSWDDYNDDYMVERSPLPVYGNTLQWAQSQQPDGSFSSFSIPEINWKVDFADSTGKNFFVKRNQDENVYIITEGKEKYKRQDVPFVTNGLQSAVELLKDTVSKKIYITHSALLTPLSTFRILHSHPSDSLFRPMMYHSDNFFAEQTLLMVSNERLGVMNDEKIIDTLLRTDLTELPQKPVWVDGSGLSRFNLFSPLDFIWLLNKMRTEFGLERMRRLLPTGGSGTLGNYYKQDSGSIYAKTGSLSGVICLSGYLISQKNRLLIFSVLVNNHTGKTSGIRRAVEKFIESVRSKY